MTVKNRSMKKYIGGLDSQYKKKIKTYCEDLYQHKALILYFTDDRVIKMSVYNFYTQYLAGHQYYVINSMLIYISSRVVEKSIISYRKDKFASISILIYFLAILENILLNQYIICANTNRQRETNLLLDLKPKNILTSEVFCQKQLKSIIEGLDFHKNIFHELANVYWYLREIISMQIVDIQSIIDICHMYLTLTYHIFCDKKPIITIKHIDPRFTYLPNHLADTKKPKMNPQIATIEENRDTEELAAFEEYLHKLGGKLHRTQKKKKTNSRS